MFSSNTTQVASAAAVYIEEIFSTFLYTGNGSTQTITNGIDLSGKGGMVWTKARVTAGFGNEVTDTVRGAGKRLITNTTGAQGGAGSSDTTGFTSSGFELTFNNGLGNLTNENYASWTFRKQPKFFDVVTYTGTGSARTVSHNLGSAPGCIIIKNTSNTSDWIVYHREVDATSPAQYYLRLNTTISKVSSTTTWNSTNPTSTEFSLGTSGNANTNGNTYVAYLFAHNAGGFGLTGTDNVISCGSFTSSSVGYAEVNLGYEPQFYLRKQVDGPDNWQIVDNMRGFTVTESKYLYPNTSGAEGSTGSSAYPIRPTATGFIDATLSNSATYIYIAIRRGPMKVPTDATKVYNAVTGTFSTGDSLSVGFPADMYIDAWRTGTLYKANYSRLVNFANSNSSASQNYLKTNTTDAEITTSQAPSLYNLWNTTANVGSWNAGVSEVWWMFRRAPSFFDEVCYTGTGSATTQTHNLGAVPELVIWKRRSSTSDWRVWQSSFSVNDGVYLNYNFAKDTDSNVQTAIPTATVLNLATGAYTNASGSTYVAYLFATCAGVSKVGTYTGNGTTQTINCGFTGGARFVLIKRTDSTGDWYVYDTARGMTVLTDPYLLLNSTAAESATLGSVTTVSTGFAVNASILAAINTNAASYIFLAIA